MMGREGWGRRGGGEDDIDLSLNLGRAIDIYDAHLQSLSRLGKLCALFRSG